MPPFGPYVSTPRRAARLALAAAAALALGGCGDVNGGEVPFAGTSTYQDPAGAYQLRLLAPPWVPSITLPSTIWFYVPAEGSLSPTTDALYTLHVSGADGDPASALAAAGAGANPQWKVSDERPVHAVSGAAGFELSGQEGPQAFHRDAFLAAPGGPTFRMRFTAKKAIGDDEMVTQMVLSFAPRGTTASGTR